MPALSLSSMAEDLAYIWRPSRDYLEHKLEDHRLQFALLQLCATLFGCAMWGWDYTTDPEGAKNTVLLHLWYLVLLVNVYNALTRTRASILVPIAVLTGWVSVVVFVMTLDRLHNGFSLGLGGFMFFMLMALAVFPGFSWRVTLGLVVVGTCIPPAMALAGWVQGFEHGLYSALMWPSCVVVIGGATASELKYLQSYRLERLFEYESNHDALTGAHNGTFFKPYLKRAMAEGRLHGAAPSVLAIDIDHLRRINEQYGRAAGDRVILKLTEIGHRVLGRHSDVFARMGGEEFSVLLPATTVKAAFALAERMRLAVEQSETTGPKGESMHFTVSIGVARGMGPGSAREQESDLLARADLALYQAKNSGRNQVCVYADNLSEA
ncbi:GGDEF domain-containing protein [Rhodoferax aquaticus]|uniref:diguanylate cyclase n=1 Tax=Rhodoferax aquaticus TaxID=2527691 RepID=A0A515ELB8_9BURK|nr:GGDEF domain-containing protein [Rhodoferax aquaticus]QDL53444.1 GGDEF domain-containing protein [Rhodoferax aquaticus]